MSLISKDVDDSIIANASKLTGVRFPAGTVGKEYFYLGDTIDPSLQIKVAIPKEKKSEFLQNKIFTEKKDVGTTSIDFGKSHSWWKVQSLKDPIHTIYDFPNGNVIECYVGEEDSTLMVYLSWVTV